MTRSRISTLSEETCDFKIEIEKLVNSGHGLGRLNDGRVVFVQGVLPTETIRIKKLCKRRGAWWATEWRIETPSPDRINNRCPVDERCGGCQFLFMIPQREAMEKQNILKSSMQRAGIATPHGVQFHGHAFEQSRQRARLHFRAGHLGFFEAKSHKIVTASYCRVLPEPSLQLIAKLETFFSNNAQLVGHINVAILDQRLLPGEPLQMALAFHSDASPPSHALQQLEKVLESESQCHWARWNKTVLVAGAEKGLPLQWHHRRIYLHPDHFFQSNQRSWDTFWELIQRWEPFVDTGAIWDVHAGSGFLCSALQRNQVIATEPDPFSFEQLIEHTKHAFPITAERFLESPQEKDLISDLAGAILDPPRTGLSRTLNDWLKASGPRRIAMFSCDLGTCIRDLKQLLTAYEIASPIHILDVNPGTSRFETFVHLQRNI